MTVPFSAVKGIVWNDMTMYFLSQRTITEAGDILDMAFFDLECVEDCEAQADAGQYGYAVADAYAGSPTDVAWVWYTNDTGQTWAQTSAAPFAAGEDISCVVISGAITDHRVIVSRGTADGANPAEIAYADVTAIGTTTWNLVNVGSVNGQYITYMFYLDDANVYAITNDGYIYKSENGGVTWTASLSTGAVQFNDISAQPDDVVWVVGASNTVYLSEDEGTSWTAITGPSSTDIMSCTVTPDGTIFVLDDDGNIWGSYDDGTNWTDLTLQGATVTEGQRVRHLPGHNHMIMVIGNLADGSGRCFLSVDGGATLRLWSLNMPTNSGLNALAITSALVTYVGGDAHPVAGTAFISRTLSNFEGL
jgi:photosystem II stability/assembly factor-like uncharacterized protein